MARHMISLLESDKLILTRRDLWNLFRGKTVIRGALAITAAKVKGDLCGSYVITIAEVEGDQ